MAQLGHQGQEGAQEEQVQLLGQPQGAKGRVLGDRGSGTVVWVMVIWAEKKIPKGEF